MGRYEELQDELDRYETRLGEIARILLDETLTAEETLEGIEEVVFGDEDARE